MKVVVLCGGKGTRLMEMTDVLPKPMLPVGDRPLLHHIFDIYKRHGLNDFYLPMGYKKEHIIAYLISLNPETYSYCDGVLRFKFSDMNVTAVDTGSDTMTGGRLRRMASFLSDAPFAFTYGDGLSSVDISEVQTCYVTHQCSTLTLVHPEGRFGRAIFDPPCIVEFGEKSETSDWINGGFSVLHPDIFGYITGDGTNLEKDVYPVLARLGKLAGYPYEGFWKCVDTKRDLLELEQIYQEEGAKWLK